MFKSNTYKIKSQRYQSKEQESVLENTEMLYNVQEKVSKLFDDYSSMATEVNYKIIDREELKTLTPKKMLQRLPITLTQIKAGNTSKNLLNKTRQIIYSLYWANKINKRVNNNILNSIHIQYKKDNIFMNSRNSKNIWSSSINT